MTTPLTQLAYHFGPQGQGARKPCPESGKEMGCVDGVLQGYRRFQDTPHKLCGGTGTVFDPMHPLTEAMWRVLAPEHPEPSYVRRSEAEVALRLLDYAQREYEVTLYLHRRGNVTVFLQLEVREPGAIIGMGVSRKLRDALSLALLEAAVYTESRP